MPCRSGPEYYKTLEFHFFSGAPTGYTQVLFHGYLHDVLPKQADAEFWDDKGIHSLSVGKEICMHQFDLNHIIGELA
jgi:hypothetical protein